LGTLGNDRERIQYEIERLNAEFEQARAEEKTRDDRRKQELDILQSNVSKREEKLEKIIKKEREKTTLIDDDERKLDKINV
jgi:multidrug resistance efflux pump